MAQHLSPMQRAREFVPAVRTASSADGWGLPWMRTAGELAPASDVVTNAAGQRMVRDAAGKLVPIEGQGFIRNVGQAAKIGTGIGAVQGATEGNGTFGERLENAATGAGTGAITGGLMRGIVIPAAQAAIMGSSAVGRGLSTLAGFRQGADERLTEALATQGMTPAQAAAELQARQDAAKFGQTQLATQQAIADLGPGTQRLAYQAKAAPGEGSTQAENFLYGRQRGQYDRVNDYVRRSLQVVRGDYAKTLDQLSQEQKNLAGPAYRQAHADPTIFDIGPTLEQHLQDNADLVGAPKTVLQKAINYFRDPQVLRTQQAAEGLQDKTLEDIGRGLYPDRPERMIVEQLRGDLSSGNLPTATMGRQQRFQQSLNEIDGLMQDAVKEEDPGRYAQLNSVRNNIEKASNIAGKTARINWNSTLTNTRRFDSAKQALDDDIDVASRKGENNQVRILTLLKKDLVKEADLATAQTPGDITTSPYYQARDIWSSRADLKDALESGRNFRGDDPEVVAQGYDDMSGAAAKRMYRIGMARQIAADLGGKKYGNDMIGYFDTPNMHSVFSDMMSKQKYNQFTNLLGGKGEAAMQATKNRVLGGSNTADKLQDVKDTDANLVARLGRNIKEKGLIGTVVSAIGDQLEKFAALKALDAKNVADMVFETDPMKQQAILQRLNTQYGATRVRSAANIAKSVAKRMIVARGGIIARDELTGTQPPPLQPAKVAPRLLPPGYTPRIALDEARQKLSRNPNSPKVRDAVTQRLMEHGLTLEHDPGSLLAPPSNSAVH